MNTADTSPAGASGRDIRDLARGTAVNLLGTAARASRFLATVVATNLFGSATYGLYDTGWKIAFVFAKVARFGLDRGVARAVVEARLRASQAGVSRAVGEGLALAVLAGMVGAVGVWLGADALARFYAQPAVGATLDVVAWSLPLMGVSTVLLAATRALRTMRYEMYVQSVGGPLFLLLGTVAAGLTHAGVKGLAAAQLLSAVGMLVQSVVYFRRCFPRLRVLGSVLSLSLRGPLARFSLPVMLSDVLTTVIWSLDQFILLKFASPSSVGIYSVARQASTVMKKAPQASGPILGPIVADLTVQGRPEELGDHLAFLFRWTLMVNLLYLGLVWLLGDRILLLFGAEFARGATVFWVLSLGMVTYGVSLPLENLQIMRGRPYVNLVYNASWLACLLALSLWLIPRQGVLGAAWASTLSQVAVTVVRLLDTMRAEGIRPLRKDQLKPIAAALAAAGVGAVVRRASPAVYLVPDGLTVLSFVATYLLLLYWLGIQAEDRLLLRRALARIRRKRDRSPQAQGADQETGK